MRFTTESKSVYEVDLANKRMRRLSGEKDPTPRSGKDGEWKVFEYIFPEKLEIGKNVIFGWDPKTTPLLKNSDVGSPVTITSQIISVFEDDQIN